MDRTTLSRLQIAAASTAVALLVLVGVLGKLTYSSSLLLPGDRGSDDAPLSGVYTMGSLSIVLEEYETAPSLGPFRDFVHAACPGVSGLAMALCMSNEMARRFPHGAPTVEFLERQYDPAADLARHLTGGPGHCVTRAGLAAAALLSVGEAARAMQLITVDGVGHNVFEVWDPQYGWVIVDPSYGHVVFHARKENQRRMLRMMSLPEGVSATFLDVPGAFDGLRIYPEPWLYTRVGKRHGPWPFRGAFVVYGYHYRREVMIHTVLLCAIIFFLGVTLVLLIEAARQRRALRRASNPC